MLKPLPIGIQTFRDIIEGGFLYVDKTRWINELIRYPKGIYFLSRPRRFGKSLLVSTLEEIFRGNKELLFAGQEFRNYWFETGTPTFLIELVKQQDLDITQLSDLEVDELSFSTYEIENLDVLPLLFQTGYLTIKAYDPAMRLFTLGYPNYEVEHAFMRYLLSS